MRGSLLSSPSLMATSSSKPASLAVNRAVSRSDLSHDRSSASSLSPPHRDLVFVVNPRGANGKTEKLWTKLFPYLRSRLDKNCNIYESLTSGPYHAADITREAIREGAHAVIAVGGDGTLHEVVNGFFWGGKTVTYHNKEAGRSTALGLIPLGTGSDFSRSMGWNNDPFEAVDRIHNPSGLRSQVDIGVVNGEDGEFHYFINVADAHLNAKAGFFASRYKKFGKLCYVIGALQAFMGHSNQDLRIMDKGIGHWRFSCIMSFPWKPILSATGYTEYYFDAEPGRVCRHVEHWNVPKMALFNQLLRPSRRKTSTRRAVGEAG